VISSKLIRVIKYAEKSVFTNRTDRQSHLTTGLPVRPACCHIGRRGGRMSGAPTAKTVAKALSAPAPSMALETITQRIFVLREQKVLLDADLTSL
jgi:hypothetical protein